MADYIGPTRTRTMECDIALRDGGGRFIVDGIVGFGTFYRQWIATFDDYYTIGGDPGDIGPVSPGDPPPSPLGRVVDLNLVDGTGPIRIYDPVAPLTGTVSISIATREIVQVGYVSGPMPWGANSYEQQWGSASTNITLLGQSSTISQSTGTGRVSGNWLQRVTVKVKDTVRGNGGCIVSITTLPTSVATSAVSSAKSHSDSYVIDGLTYSYDNDATAAASSAEANAREINWGGQANSSATAFCSIFPDRNATLFGRLQRMLAAWPDPIKYRTTAGGAWVSNSDGDFSASINQKHYETYAGVSPAPFLAGSDQHTAAERVNIHPTAGDPTDTYPRYYLDCYGPRWDAVEIAWVAAQTIDDGTSLSPTGDYSGAWTADNGGSVSVVSGAIHLTGASGKTLYRTFTAGSFHAYSRLRLKLKASAAAHTITVRFGADITINSVTYKAKSWSVTTGTAGAFTDLFIDLGGETDGPNYGIQGQTTFVFGGAYGSPYFGTSRATIFLIGLGAGSYDIEEMELLTAPDGMGGHDSPLIHLYSTGLDSRVDGIPGLHAPIGPLSAVNFINANEAPAYSATDLTPTTSPGAEPWPLAELQTSWHPFLQLGGGGLMFSMSGAVANWTLPFDAGGFGTGAGLPAQWRVSELSWDWPESDLGGFLWADGSGGKAIGAGATRCGSLWGRILESTDSQTAGDPTLPAGRDPAASVGVSLTDLDGGALATTTTGADGTFSFPAKAARGGDGAARFFVDGVPGFIEVPIIFQRNGVVVVRVDATEGTLLAMAVSATGRVVRAYRDGSDNIVLEFWNRAGWDSVVTSLTTTGNGAMSYDHQEVDGKLWLALEESGGIKSRHSEDEGGTWSVAVTIVSSGTYPAIVVSPTGLRHYFWYDGGALKTKILDSQDTVVLAATAIVASGAAASPIDAVHDGALILLTYKTTGGAVVTVISSDGGVTFT